ncbi:TPA: hypothetical protein QDA99_006623 [Burkholderia vietnamiensis]|uniref:hypothetical protein n=1 Tax=Burkholderia vietnamiensis TaxID=60552 RepID=UPI00158D2069|nr:hypothetical protein [Burkholderia vietnamiensis]HDR9003015.1 hypothetical protein [Burkholderia vietnamiensis]HDR9006941.1 hypothetical protein [Burkholderia vietnamiensis]
MDAMAFWKQVGSKKVVEVCDAAETSFPYFKHIAHGRKRPSYDLAKKLSEHGTRITGHTMDIITLLEGAKRADK